jgi:hypothetical protein
MRFLRYIWFWWGMAPGGAVAPPPTFRVLAQSETFRVLAQNESFEVFAEAGPFEVLQQ